MRLVLPVLVIDQSHICRQCSFFFVLDGKFVTSCNHFVAVAMNNYVKVRTIL